MFIPGDVVRIKKEYLEPYEDPETDYVVMENYGDGKIKVFVEDKNSAFGGYVYVWADYMFYKVGEIQLDTIADESLVNEDYTTELEEKYIIEAEEDSFNATSWNDTVSELDFTDGLTFNFSDLVNYRKLKNYAGIYLYTNIQNNHKYVGQARNLYKRLLEHKQTANRKSEINLDPIDSAIKNYGTGQFNITILKFIDKNPGTETTLAARLNKWEEYFIALYNTYNNTEDYNLTPGGNDLNYYLQSSFWDNNRKRFNKRLLNKVRFFIKESKLGWREQVKYLADNNIIQLSTATIKKINACEGIYKLNYYEKNILGFTTPISNHSEINSVARFIEYYLFDINTPTENLEKENAIAGPFKSAKEVQEYIFGTGTSTVNKQNQINSASRGSQDYIYGDYKVKRFSIE